MTTLEEVFLNLFHEGETEEAAEDFQQQKERIEREMREIKNEGESRKSKGAHSTFLLISNHQKN